MLHDSTPSVYSLSERIFITRMWDAVCTAWVERTAMPPASDISRYRALISRMPEGSDPIADMLPDAERRTA